MTKQTDAPTIAALAPNLIVEDIEACLPFWIDRLGFVKTVEVPHEDRLGFVILASDASAAPAVRLMLQSRASLRVDVPPLAEGPFRAVLYVNVADLGPLRARFEASAHVVPERVTFYGAKEIIVTDPAGNAIFFAQH